MNGKPAEMTASMGSSHHVFLSPRVLLIRHVAQTLMWLLDVRSPRSDAECGGGDRQGAFNRNFAYLDISGAFFFEASFLLVIDTAETSDGTVPPLAGELASTTVLCVARSRHPSRSFSQSDV